MNISLTPYLEQFVQNKLSSGVYNSASEVIREGLRLLEERDKIQQIQLDEIRKEIRIGIDSGVATALSIEDIKTRGREMLAGEKL